MMKKPVGQLDGKTQASNADAPSAMADGKGTASGLHPLMAQPAAAMAAATAIGLGMTSQMAGFMFGAMQSFVEAAQNTGVKTVAEPEPEPIVEPKTDDVASVEIKPTVRAVKKAKEQKAPRAKRVVETVADDLKRISGVGPKLEQVLNGMGIRTFADIASWSDADAQRIDDELGFGGRIVRDGWIAQATTLIKG